MIRDLAFGGCGLRKFDGEAHSTCEETYHLDILKSMAALETRLTAMLRRPQRAVFK